MDDDPIDLESPDPIDLATGAFMLSEQDFAARGIRGMDIAFERHYTTAVSSDSAWGRSWDSPLLTKLSDTGTQTAVTWMNGEGRADLFNVASYTPGTQTTTYTTPSGFSQSLVKTGLGSSAVFKLTSADGTVLTYAWMFALGGRNWYHIDSIQDTCGNTIVFSFCPHGRLLTVTDSTGGVWTFNHVQSGVNEARISSLTAPWGATTSYGYSAAGDLITVTLPATPAFPTGSTYTYGYGGSSRLQTIQEPGKTEPYLVNTYDTARRLVSQRFGSANQLTTIDYAQYPIVRVTNRAGVVIEHTVNPTSHQVTQRKVIGTGVPPPTFTTTYAYNVDYLMTQCVHPGGMVEEWVYQSSSDPRQRHNLVEFSQRESLAAAERLTSKYDYDAFGKITRIRSPNVVADPGLDADPLASTRFSYDAAGNMTRCDLPYVTDPDGTRRYYVITWTYDARGRVASMTDPRGLLRNYAYSGLQALPVTEIEDPSGASHTITRTYNSRGDLLSIESPCGCSGGSQRVTYTYDARSQVTEVRERISATTDRVTNYTYTACGELASVRREAPGIGDGWADLSYTYDLLHNVLTRSQDVDSSRLLVGSVTYDNDERVVSSVAPTGSTCLYSYNERGLLTESRKVGDPATVQDDITWSFEYNANGQRTAVVNPVGHAFTIVRDGFGSVTSVTDAAGFGTELTYDREGNILTFALLEPNGTPRGNWFYEYDEHGRIRSLDSVLALSDGTPIGDGWYTTTYAYDGLDKLVSVTNDAGGRTTYTYDIFGRLVSSRDSVIPSSGVDYEYYANGLVHRIFAVNGNQETGLVERSLRAEYVSYNDLGLPLEVLDAYGGATRFEWNNRGEQVAVVDARGFRTEFSLDLLGRLVTERQYATVGSSTSANDIVTDFEYTDLSQIKRITGRNQPFSVDRVTTFDYDLFDRRFRETRSDGSAVTLTWNKHSQELTRLESDGTLTTRSYGLRDELSGLTVQRAPGVGGHTYINITRDALGRATTLENDGFVVNRAFTTRGGLEFDEIVAKDGTYSARSSAVIDAHGRMTQLVQPSSSGGSPRRTTWTRDVLGRVVSAAVEDGLGGTATVTYTRCGSRVISLESGSWENRYEVDVGGRLASASRFVGGSLLDQQSYLCDSVGNVIGALRKTFKPDGTALPYDEWGGGARYEYDAFGRVIHSYRGLSESDYLANVTSNALRHSAYSYDRLSNRLSLSETNGAGTTVTNYVTNPLNSYTQVGPTPASFDANGSMQSFGSETFAYDRNNRPISWSAGGPTRTFEYDALGRRVRTTTGGDVETIAYFRQIPTERVILNGATVISRQLLWPSIGTDHWLGLSETIGGSRRFLFDDGFGTPLSLVDVNGVAVEAYRYEDFGARRLLDLTTGVTNGSVGTLLGNPLCFTGRLVLRDSEDSLDFRARVYRPRLGRFGQADPLRFPDAIANLYPFGGNNPWSRDPSGRGIPAIHKWDTEDAIDDLGQEGYELDPGDAAEIVGANVNQDDVDGDTDGAGPDGGDPDVPEGKGSGAYDAIGNAVAGDAGVLPKYHALGDESTRIEWYKYWETSIGDECLLLTVGHACHFVQDYVYHRDREKEPYPEDIGHLTENLKQVRGNSSLKWNPDNPFQGDGWTDPGLFDLAMSRMRESCARTKAIIKSFIDKCGPKRANARWFPRYKGGLPPVTTPRNRDPKGDTTPPGLGGPGSVTIPQGPYTGTERDRARLRRIKAVTGSGQTSCPLPPLPPDIHVPAGRTGGYGGGDSTGGPSSGGVDVPGRLGGGDSRPNSDKRCTRGG